jgi:hypothetical protein
MRNRQKTKDIFLEGMRQEFSKGMRWHQIISELKKRIDSLDLTSGASNNFSQFKAEFTPLLKKNIEHFFKLDRQT